MVETKTKEFPLVLTDQPIEETSCRHHLRRFWFILLLLAMTIFFNAAYFDNREPHVNVLSEFDLTRAIVEQGTFAIDAYANNTCDKAFYNEHYYCDKSPVNSFLGVPALALYRWLTAARDGRYDVDRARYATTVAVEGTGAALLAVMLALALIQRGAPPVRAVAASAIWICATPIFAYAVLFFSYVPACVFLMAGYLSIAPVLTSHKNATRQRLFFGGLLTGLACWTLNTLAIPALALTLALAGQAWLDASPAAGGKGSALWRRLWPWALGGMLGTAGNFIYNRYLFGSFLASPYHYESLPLFRDQMSHGLMGATIPRLQVAWLVTFHKFQGMFLWFPVTALAAGGLLWQTFRFSPAAGSRAHAGVRLECCAALLTFAGLLIYVSAYYMWWGGHAYVPRHLIPALPLMALGLLPWLKSKNSRFWFTLLILGVISGVANITVVAVGPQPPPAT